MSKNDEDMGSNNGVPQISDLASISEIQLQSVERINQALVKTGIDIEGNITRDEISLFLDQNSTNGNFNQALKEKIFKALYNEQTTEIPVRDFVINFSSLASELRKVLSEYERKYKENNKTIQALKAELNKYKNERLKNGVSPYATFRIKFLKIEFKKLEESMENKYFNLVLTLFNSDKDEIKQVNTEMFGVQSAIINEEFTFSPKSKDDYLILQLFAYDDPNNPDNSEHNEVGQLTLALNNIENQDEFEIDLVIPSRKNPHDEEHNLTVKAKAIFIWSQYEYNADLLKNKEELKKKIEPILLKTKNFYDSLYNLQFFNGLKQNFDIKIDSASDNSYAYRTKKNTSGREENGDNVFSLENTADETNRSKKKVPNWVKIIGLLIPIFALLLFINLLVKSDYINFTLAAICLLCLCNNQTNKKIFSLKWIIVSFAISFVFDLLWLIICGGDYIAGNNSTITKKIVFFNTIVNIGIKAGLLSGFITLNSKK